MNDTIRVYVMKVKDRDNYMMKYIDPQTGQHVRRSTGEAKKREAEKVAAKWEAELQEGRYQKQRRMPWDDFVDRFEEDGTGGLKGTTVNDYLVTLRTFKRLCRPRGVHSLTTARMATFARELRKPHRRYKKDKELTTRSEACVASHLRNMKRVSRWAHRQGYLVKAPHFDMPKGGAKRMKGRPITTEEFERMLSKVSGVVGEKAAESWKHLLRGLWASGLRLGEALALRWDRRHPGSVTVLLNGRKSMLVFDADSQKSGKAQLVPLSPEAVTLLEPYQRDTGFVFTPRRKDGLPKTRVVDKVGKVIGKIGSKANVCVDPATGKMATAHDLRRAFGYRWSRRIMPSQLKELMRHASIETTMTYYVGQNAETTAGELWDALGHNLGHIAESEESQKSQEPRETSSFTGS